MAKEATTKVLTTPEYLRVLDEEKLITFAVFYEGHEVHHQISILEFDTRDKIEKRIAEIAVQVMEELEGSNNLSRKKPISGDIQALVNEHLINPEK